MCDAEAQFYVILELYAALEPGWGDVWSECWPWHARPVTFLKQHGGLRVGWFSE